MITYVSDVKLALKLQAILDQEAAAPAIRKVVMLGNFSSV
jgi:hypothetical protein